MDVKQKYNWSKLKHQVNNWSLELGFQEMGVTDLDLNNYTPHYLDWLEKKFHGEMSWIAKNIDKRTSPEKLVDGTIRILSFRMDYLPPDAGFAKNLKQDDMAYISRYASGRDYHKIMRKRLQKLADKINNSFEDDFKFRAFVDSAPVLERPIAEKAGIGWQGKNSLIINKKAGSWFFLGELYVNIPLPIDNPVKNECGKCSSCIKICPTNAIVGDKVVDATKCISYLTIEYAGVIPIELRKKMGNRIYGCDDCQLVCPWNRFASITNEKDFYFKDITKNQKLFDLLRWDESQFLQKTEGSPIRRIGYVKWIRNIINAMGNSNLSEEEKLYIKSLRGKNKIWDEHIDWSLNNQIKSSKPNTQKLIRIIEKGLTRDA